MADSDSDSDTGVEDFFNRLGWLFTAHNLFNPNNDEEKLLKKLRGLVTNIKWSPEDVTDLFDALRKRYESTNNDRSDLLSWMLNMLHCIEINYITPTWKSEKGKTLIELVRDKTVTDKDLNNYLADGTKKTLDEILEEIRQQKLNQVDEKLLEEVRDIVSSVDKALTSHTDGSKQTGLKKDLLTLCRAVEKTYFKHFKPRLTQMVSWCIMALSKTGRLIQVGTGEGKSCIVAMFAAFRALRGQQVDILTSSSVLAERDLKEWQDFYQHMKISVDCNTNKQAEDQLKECYKCQVVYGTADKFAGDRLSQDFERKDTFGKRKFQCAIVDEVDSLMLDKGNHVVYIGTDMPALQHLNPLLAYIWATANQYTKIGTQTIVGRKYHFLQVVLENIPKVNNVEFTVLQMAEGAGILANCSVKNIRNKTSLFTEKTASVAVNQLATFFEAVERRFPSCQFDLHCIKRDGSIEQLNQRPQNDTDIRKRVALLLLNGGLCQYMYTDTENMVKAAEAEIKHLLHFTPCEPSQDECSCHVPGFLSDLVNSKLKVWIENAFKAKAMTMGHEYIIESHGIVPVDYSSTGVVQNFMTLTDGLQQFLEMKHAKTKLSDMAAITNYMSNVGLFLKYGDQVFGITGTLGQQAETETLQKIYKGIKTCQIPLFKRRKLFEVEGVIVDDEKEWTEKICSVITKQTRPTAYRAPRAVLVICETIKRAIILHQALQDKVQSKMLYISNNMDNTAITDKMLEAGDVIIATNLAGRGTDLQVSDQVKRAGGLFVVQAFLPKNARVEAQAFGRTARQGSPGSAQLIICSSHLPEPLKLLALMGKLQSLLENVNNDMAVYQHLFVTQFRMYHKKNRDEVSESLRSTLSGILKNISDSGMKTVKKVRDDLAAQNLASYLKCEIPNIKKKEELFSQYLETLDEVYKSCNNQPADSDLSALNEFWGMWLLTNFNDNDSVLVLKNKLTKDLKTAMEKLKHKESPSSNLHHYTAFGNELLKKGDVAESIKMYTKAIQEDHYWAAVAFYNRAFVSLKRYTRQDSNCINRALQDLQNSLKSVEVYHTQIKVTHRYSGCDSSSRFDKHMAVRYEMLKSFKGNITKAIKKLENARDRCENVKVHEKSILFLIPPQHLVTLFELQILVELALLINPSDHLKVYQRISHPDFDISFELKRFESLGLTKVYTLDTTSTLRGFFSRLFR